MTIRVEWLLAAAALLGVAPWQAGAQQPAAPQPAPLRYAVQRNREVNLFNDGEAAVRYAAMLLNPAMGTHSAYYGIDPGTVAHEIVGFAGKRYELKQSEQMRIRVMGQGDEPEYVLEQGSNYRFVHREGGRIVLEPIANVGIVEVRNELNREVHYELRHRGGQAEWSGIIVTLAPGSKKYHNVAGDVECLLGLPHERERYTVELSQPGAATLSAGGRYVLRYGPAGRLRSDEDRWDLYPADDSAGR